MGAFKYVPPSEVAERHRAARRETQSRGKAARQGAPPPSAPAVPRRQEFKNVEQVLSLGSTRYFTINSIGLTLCIPPVPFKLGQRVIDIYTKTTNAASHVARDGSRKKEAQDYYKGLDQLAKLLWSHVRPIGPIKRRLWALGLTKNPLRRISEGELVHVTDFFFQGRMKSSVQSLSEEEIKSSFR